DILGTDGPRNIAYEIQKWNYLGNIDYQIDKVTEKINKPSFLKGIQFTNSYDPAWLPYLDRGFIDAAVNGANWIILSPTRMMESAQLPFLLFDPRSNITFGDLLIMHSYAQDAGLNQGLYPQIATELNSINEFWNTTSLSYIWWIEWFSQYERFILDYANFAENNDFAVFIIGGNSISPALPSGRLPNGQLSNTPHDFADKWQALIEKVRAKYSGQIIFAIPSNLAENIDHAFLANVDAFLIETDSALTSNLTPNVIELSDRFNKELDSSIYQIVEKYQKPVIVGINYASIDGSASNCINLGAPCSELYADYFTQGTSIDLAEQADVYKAIIDAIIDRDWITGVVSQGYFPAAVVRDFSSSIRGKPAMDVLSYYFNEVIR
ncbi:MAG: hypothetical protein MUP85_01025, partial [Candidatus Lokiarchaeota archaeon]|nr:hypothetical protein [Candidatus Lokiarchaeota archaeon]